MRLERKKNSFALCSLHFSILTSSVVLFCRFSARVCFLPLSCFLYIVSFYLHLIFQRFQCKYFNFNGFDLCGGWVWVHRFIWTIYLFIHFFPLLYVVVHLLFQQQKTFDIRRRQYPYKNKYKSAYNTYVQIHWNSEETKTEPSVFYQPIRQNIAKNYPYVHMSLRDYLQLDYICERKTCKLSDGC